MKNSFQLFVVVVVLTVSGCVEAVDGPEAVKLEASFTFEVQVAHESAPSAGIPNVTVHLRAIKNNDPSKQFDWTLQTDQYGWVVARCGYNFNNEFDKVDFYASLQAVDDTDFTSPNNYMNRYWTSVNYDEVEDKSKSDRSANITVTAFLRQ